MGVTERAPAKLNLYLHVIGRRADNYHLIDSLVAFADIGDELDAAPAAGLSLDITGPFADALAGDSTENLVWRAATLLVGRLGRAPDVALRLVKNLPVASGIGGGSSDAAATLRALVRLWRMPVGEELLNAIAAALGADVPACLAARSVWVGGVGEELEITPPLPPVFLVLANPGIALPTAAVFKRRVGSFSKPGRFVPPADAAALARLLAERGNDLTDAAIGLVPEIGEVMRCLDATDGALLARMSGSGATCFALYADARQAEAAAVRLAADHPRWWVKTGALCHGN
ncbi:MAG TPA: 4-(cytidine 5'-diphospho)-2-C-methyl-D-erythritol kinase [Stellaceae bacterium]|nr:4-(cytidine 5'-diphospho)-2-C-methyl-D-erythritol kinase [Stellaceae bacterium]